MYVLEHGWEDVTFYDNSGQTVVDNLDKLSVDISPLVNTLANEYEFSINIGTWEMQETAISISADSTKKYYIDIFYRLSEGTWRGYCDPYSVVTNAMCEEIHQAFAEIILS